MKETKQEHLRFLRTYKEAVVGDRLPDAPASDEADHPTLSACIRGHLLLFIVSVHCELCYDALRELYAFVLERPHSNVVILLEGDESAWATLNEQFAGRARVFRKSKAAILRELGTRGVPWGYAVQADGRICASLPCSAPEDFEQLAAALG
ncbi:hypothetical protein DUZ99_15535 [Xylanibacillus composti]|uniref:Thioredoxin domain-containing protein n=1 Tax=Xylanibacillus composti TaxID=1572762 RepID=A0A8J4H3U6_9BACL|nr:hypothetical protein [Xylanibacillus composti]MDT9726395.1 hypothetical protein [Xylanibacillus composti]GIQ70364.1 hypothetical protein XYCOK13_31880 [Xylanibacillus composti]